MDVIVLIDKFFASNIKMQKTRKRMAKNGICHIKLKIHDKKIAIKI